MRTYADEHRSEETDLVALRREASRGEPLSDVVVDERAERLEYRRVDLLFFDTSPLVKRYYEEAGTAEVDQLIESDRTIVISSHSVIETVSAVRRKHDCGELTEEEMTGQLGAFFHEALEDFAILPLAESAFALSFDLILEDGLRTLDRLQLSAAMAISTDEDGVTFVCADRNLIAVARDRGFDTILPSE